MPHRRLVRSARTHPVRAILLAVVVIGSLTLTTYLLSNRTQQNADKIADAPTKADLYAALADVRASQRRGCRVANDRFSSLGRALHLDAPQVERRFPHVAAALRPRNCLRQYPVPSRAKFELSPREAKRAIKHRRQVVQKARQRARSPSPRPRRPHKQHPPSTPRPPPPAPVRPSPPRPSPPSQQQPAGPSGPPVETPPPAVRERLCAQPQLKQVLPFC